MNFFYKFQDGKDPVKETNNVDDALLSRVKCAGALTHPKTQELVDLAICSYTLLDLTSTEKRQNLLRNLFFSTEELVIDLLCSLRNAIYRIFSFLILIERATYSGFTLINEARDFLFAFAKENNVRIED